MSATTTPSLGDAVWRPNTLTDQDDEIQKVEFTNSWPSDDESDGFQSYDEDGWNIMSAKDQGGAGDWYSFVPNKTATVTSTVTSITDFEEEQWSTFPSSEKQEAKPASDNKSLASKAGGDESKKRASPAAKLRSKLPLLLCKTGKSPGKAVKSTLAPVLSSSSTPSSRKSKMADNQQMPDSPTPSTLGAIRRHPIVTDSILTDNSSHSVDSVPYDEDPTSRPTFQESSTSSWMHSANLFNNNNNNNNKAPPIVTTMGALDKLCAETTPTKKYIHLFQYKSDDEDTATASISTGSRKSSSALSHVVMDSKLARALHMGDDKSPVVAGNKSPMTAKEPTVLLERHAKEQVTVSTNNNSEKENETTFPTPEAAAQHVKVVVSDGPEKIHPMEEKAATETVSVESSVGQVQHDDGDNGLMHPKDLELDVDTDAPPTVERDFEPSGQVEDKARPVEMDKKAEGEDESAVDPSSAAHPRVVPDRSPEKSPSKPIEATVQDAKSNGIPVKDSNSSPDGTKETSRATTSARIDCQQKEKEKGDAVASKPVPKTQWRPRVVPKEADTIFRQGTPTTKPALLAQPTSDDEISELTNDPALELVYKTPQRLGGRVAERHKWLQQQAFRRAVDEQATTKQSAAPTRVSGTVEKFGGGRTSAVLRRKQEWESKWVAKPADATTMPATASKLTRKTKWEARDGTFKKKVVVDAQSSPRSE